MISNRRYDIDWLRVIAIGLLLIYHVAIGFQPWGVFIGFIQNSESNQAIWIPMSLLNVWRIPLLFFVSGMGVWFAIQRRNWKQLLIERSKRILVPFLFGMITIVPIHIYIWQSYYHQEPNYMVNPAHLWFLGNIFIYVLVLSPLFFYLKNNENGKFKAALKKILSHPIGLLVLIIPFIIEAELVKPENFEMYAMTTHGFILGLIAFFTGFCCVYSGKSFWNTVTKYKWYLLITSFTIYLIRVLIFDLKTPDYLMSIESCLWIFTIFGVGHSYLNKPGMTLAYLSKAAYPVYIIHMVFIYLGSVILFPLNISAVLKFIILNLITIMGCLITYEFVIRRIGIIGALFGLKSNKAVEISKLKLGTTS